MAENEEELESDTNKKITRELHLRDEEEEEEEEHVPSEVQDWLASTFTASTTGKYGGDKKTTFKCVANVIKAGILVDSGEKFDITEVWDQLID